MKDDWINEVVVEVSAVKSQKIQGERQKIDGRSQKFQKPQEKFEASQRVRS